MIQRAVWDAIAGAWKSYRKKPVPEATAFLRAHRGRILDIGCGSGRNFVKIKGSLTGVDFSEAMIALARQSAKERGIPVRLRTADMTALPFRANTFDAAICVAGLQCVRGAAKRMKAAREMFRVLKPGGEALIVVWNRDQPKFRKKEAYLPWRVGAKIYKRYYYLYRIDELRDLLEKCGLEVIDIHGGESRAYNVFPKNIIAVARKTDSTKDMNAVTKK